MSSKHKRVFPHTHHPLQRTSWVWVVTLSTNITQPDNSGAPEPSSSLTFRNATQVVNSRAKGMLKGVLLMQEQHETSLLASSSSPGRTFLTNSPKPAKEVSSGHRVHVGGMMPRRDWFWELTLVGSYVTHNLSLFKPLWPQTSYDFHGGNIYIAFSQKAGTIENRVNTDVMDARGYLADMLKIVMEALNATGVLRLTRGAGGKDRTGTWNGVIGVVEADIGAVDFMPNHQRKEVVDFSVAIGQDPVIIFSSAPYIIIKPMLLLQIFSPEVWACLAGAVLGGGAVLSWLRWVESSLTPTTSDMSRLPSNVILVFKMQVFQSKSYVA
ncbi:Glutamate receptor ionotropic, NMDA 2B [Portunus trituberculatus]|uniref:Glutamate receptor ionotropic, NMDA 2B n=1 Tax=Portunus trituberculatus TaxID=210409 RepID=A0A5B7H3P0_PORTR|nr:Glutamate receptor ionotropic, NMDA 2B [Portunus trituberculatus]